jgi:hypothetical protein
MAFWHRVLLWILLLADIFNDPLRRNLTVAGLPASLTWRSFAEHFSCTIFRRTGPHRE